MRKSPQSNKPQAKHNGSHEVDHQSIERKKWCLEIATFVVLTLYAGLTGWQAFTNQKIANLSQQQFTSSERPYVWMPYARITTVLNEGKVTSILVLANYGKSPAVEEVSEGNVFFGSDAQDHAYKWMDQNRGKRLSPPSDVPMVSSGSYTVVPPSVPAKADFFSVDNVQFTSDRIPSAPEVELIKNKARYVFVVAHVQYRDTAGNYYFSNVCFFNVPANINGGDAVGGSMASCGKYNEIH
jgi:hypothetical protein